MLHHAGFFWRSAGDRAREAMAIVARASMRGNDIDRILYRLADYPVLEKLAQKRTIATRLDARACRCIDAQAVVSQRLHIKTW